MQPPCGLAASLASAQPLLAHLNCWHLSPLVKWRQQPAACPARHSRPALHAKLCCRVVLQNAVKVFVDDEAKLTLHGLVQHYLMINEDEKNKKLIDLLDNLDFNQVSCCWPLHMCC